LSNVIASTGAVVANRRRIGKITDNYQELIGRGGFGQVYKGTWHGRQVAVKESALLGVAAQSSRLSITIQIFM
jgi:hypothetical protein